ncbi:hypothetical protein ACHAXR_010135 [Thalassiosira sp. AJA248-18]
MDHSATAASSTSTSSTFPTNRSKHILETETTDAQSATEDECAPFFVDMQSLSVGQLDHLRIVGLLPPLLPQSSTAAAARGGKAARLLGVQDDGPPRIELLDEEEGVITHDDEMCLDNHNHGQKGNNNGSVNSPSSIIDPYAIRLLRAAHTSYLTKALSNPLPRGFKSLDSSHPWMVYWCLHSLDLLGYFDYDDVDNDVGFGDALKDVEVLQKGHLLQRIVSTLDHCWTDVSLTFGADEVAKDVRLKQLFAEQGDKQLNLTQREEVVIVGGGFGGGPQQMPHCAPTYAAVLSLCIVASLGLEQRNSHPYHEAGKSAMDLITKRKSQLYAFFLTLREQQRGEGSEEDEGERIAFRMQHDGEIDVRAAYCILAPSYVLGLLNTKQTDDRNNDSINPLLSPSISRHIASCQTFEGGFGAEPYNEAHGGYTFCALAALRILDSVSMIDVNSLSSWLARRQMGYEGGFCGRTNKLVDGCYSFWQGGAVAVLDGWYNDETDDDDDAPGTTNELSFDEVMLQRYILLCAQDVNGGLRDKPSKPKDFYHSCYNLSGLSVAQHAVESWPPPPSTKTKVVGNNEKEVKKFNSLFGDVNVNVIGRTDPVVNIRVERVKFMLVQPF